MTNAALEMMARQMRRFLVYGFSIASDFDLLLEEDTEALEPGLTIRAASPDFFTAFRSSEDAGAPPKMCRHEPLPDGSSYVSWYGLCDFFVSSDGRTIICGPRGDAFPEAHVSFLLSFVLSFAFLRLGDEPLHATVVEFDGEAIGFLGDSGAGKSTLASYFMKRGARLVTDDMLRVTFDDQTVIAHPGPPRIKLLPESAGMFLQGASCKEVVNPFSVKRLIAPSEEQKLNKGVPLKALYVLDHEERVEDANSVGLEKLKSVQASMKIISSTFNAAIATGERLERQLRTTGKILSRIPVFSLSYPRRFDALDSVYETIIAQGKK